jgi:hypothetical protein
MLFLHIGIYSFGHNLNDTMWKVYLKVILTKFRVIPTVWNVLIPSNVGVQLKLLPDDSVLRWVLIVLYAFNSDIVAVVAKVLDHDLDYIISV